MPKNPWIETEKESEFVNGQWVEKKKRFSRPLGISQRTKEIWEIIFKFFAAIAIFSPFLIISLQNKSNINRERKANLSIVYSGILTDLRVFSTFNNTTDTSNFKGVINRLGAEYPAKLAVYGSDRITNIYDTVVRSMTIWQSMRELRKTYNEIRDQTDLLGNMSDYLLRDSVVIMTYKTYRRDTTAVLNRVLELFTDIATARDVCTDLVAQLQTVDPKQFGELQRTFSSALAFINQLDRSNTLTWDGFTNENHGPNDEIPLYFLKEYNRLHAVINEFEKHMQTIDALISQKQNQLQVEFRNELK